MIGVGALALLPSAKKSLDARTEVSEPPAPACGQQTWLRFDRNCLSRRGLPWMAGHGGSIMVPLEVAAPANPSQEPSPEGQQAAMLPEEPQKPALLQSAPQQSATDQPSASTIEQPIPQPPVQQTAIVDPAHETPTQPPTVAERRTSKPAIRTPTGPMAAKKASHGERPKKPSAAEDFKQGRKLGAKLQDIPISSYSADGTSRTVVIRPTSIQDIYFYSSPR
jgi:hypothetical protein